MSAYSNKYKFIFIHIPKNAGSTFVINYNKNKAIEDFDTFEALNDSLGHQRDPVFGNHFTLQMVMDLVDQHSLKIDYHKYFKFCVIRNPWERMLSLYNMRLRKINKTFQGKPRNTDDDKRLLREGFIPWLLYTQHVSDSVLTRMPQISWVKDRNNKIFCDRIIRIENYTTELSDVLSSLNIPLMNMKYINKSSIDTSKYQDHYTAKGRSFIEKYFEEDIDQFKFTF